MGVSAEAIKAELDRKGAHNRSGKRWSVGELRRLVRSVYAGLSRQRLGTFKRSQVYPELVPRKEWEKATQNVKKVTEELETAFWGLLQDTRGDVLN